MIKISVQRENFNTTQEHLWLTENNDSDGAVVTFIGQVRSNANKVKQLFLEHYPIMTEKCLSDIANQAHARWPIARISIIHRIGLLNVGDQIVYVGVTSQHRKAAFEANEFIMDYLKTSAPFWKKEISSNGESWVDAKHSDQQQVKRWSQQ